MQPRSTGALVALGAITALAVTLVTSAPAPLPSIALGSRVLFHLERMLALLSGFLVLLVVLQRAWSGQLPSEISTQGVTYTAEEAKGRGG